MIAEQLNRLVQEGINEETSHSLIVQREKVRRQPLPPLYRKVIMRISGISEGRDEGTGDFRVAIDRRTEEAK
jgi:hypothetical protein